MCSTPEPITTSWMPLAICEAADAHLLRVVDEVLPGVPCSVITDGALAGVPLVTKSGGFGDDETLAAACVWLLSDPADPDDEEWDEADEE